MGVFPAHAVLEYGLENPLSEVREIIWKEIEEFTADGDPFAKEMLDRREVDSSLFFGIE